MKNCFLLLTLSHLASILVGAQDATVVCPSGYTWANGICSPNGPTDGQPICPEDFWWNGSQCQKFLALCPPGYVHNRTTGVCDKVGAGGQRCPDSRCDEKVTPTCPSGFFYNTQRNLCYPINPCPAGLVYANGRCEATFEPEISGPTCEAGYTYNSLTGSCDSTCADGSYWYNGKCVTTGSTDPTCLRGNLVNGVCVYQNTQQPTCAGGYTYENGQCVRKRYVAPTSCPSGFVLDGNVCRGVEQVSARCPFNTQLRGNECVRVESAQPTCNFGYVLQNGRCEKSSSSVPTCPDDHELINGQCVRILVSTPDCPRGYEYDRGSCVKKVVIPLECPPGYTMQDNQMCSRTETRSPSCPYDAQLEGNTCLYIEYTSYSCPTDYFLINGICERTLTESPRCPPEYKLNFDGKCERLIIVRPPPPVPIPVPTPYPTRLTCPTAGPVQPCPSCERPCGQQNSAPQVVIPPINNYVYNNNTIHAPVNVTTTNVNTIHITSTSNCKRGTKTVETQEGSTTVVRQECIEEKEPEAETVVTAPKEKCCTVVGPRQCQRQANEWSCFHRKHHRCGEFCTRDNIQLRPRRPMYRQNVLVMPPYQPVHAYLPTGRLDCSRCLRSYARCPGQCYQYDQCEGGSCEYMDQSSFCGTYGGEGCSTDDGCLDGNGCY